MQGRMDSAGCSCALTCQTKPRKAHRVCLGFGDGYGLYSFKQRNKLDGECFSHSTWQSQDRAQTISLAIFWRILAVVPPQECLQKQIQQLHCKNINKQLCKEVLSVRTERERPCRLW